MSMATRARRVGLKARLSTDTAPGLPFLFYRLVGRLRAIAQGRLTPGQRQLPQSPSQTGSQPGPAVGRG